MSSNDQEPISGVQGGGTANDPYDKGNDEAANQKADAPSDAQPSDTTGDPSDATSGEVGSDRNQAADAPTKDPESEGQELGSKDADGNFRMPHSDAEREKLMMKGEFPRDPNDHSGEPLKMHSQSSGNDDSNEDADAEGDDEKKKDRKDSVAHEGGGPHGEEKGDGTKYVKSSGVAADGGDFDAVNPGAGAEANRLLESKGLHKSKPDDAANQPDDSNDTSGSTAQGDDASVSKLQKIKDKLHIS